MFVDILTFGCRSEYTFRHICCSSSIKCLTFNGITEVRVPHDLLKNIQSRHILFQMLQLFCSFRLVANVLTDISPIHPNQTLNFAMFTQLAFVTWVLILLEKSPLTEMPLDMCARACVCLINAKFWLFNI